MPGRGYGKDIKLQLYIMNKFNKLSRAEMGKVLGGQVADNDCQFAPSNTDYTCYCCSADNGQSFCNDSLGFMSNWAAAWNDLGHNVDCSATQYHYS